MDQETRAKIDRSFDLSDHLLPISSSSTTPERRQHTSMRSPMEEEKEEEEEEEQQQQQQQQQEDNSTSTMEAKIRLNLQKQQENYQRQRQLLDHLIRSSSSTTKIVLSSSSSSDEEQEEEEEEEEENDKKTSSHLRRQQKQLETSVRRHVELAQKLTEEAFNQRSQYVLDNSKKKKKKKMKDKKEQEDLRDLKEEEEVLEEDPFVSSIHPYNTTSPRSMMMTRERGGGGHLDGRGGQYDLIAQEASNDALRKQLELLRRLQLENNRFRQETRHLREQVDVFSKQKQFLEVDNQKLKEQVKELTQKQQENVHLKEEKDMLTNKFTHTMKQLTCVQQKKQRVDNLLKEKMEENKSLQERQMEENNEFTKQIAQLKKKVKQFKQMEHKWCLQEKLLNEEIMKQKAQMDHLENQIQELTVLKENVQQQVEFKQQEIKEVEISSHQCMNQFEQTIQKIEQNLQNEKEKKKKIELIAMSLQEEKDQLEQQIKQKQSFLSQKEQKWTNQKQEFMSQCQTLHDANCDLQMQLATSLQKEKENCKLIGELRTELSTNEKKLYEIKQNTLETRQVLAEETRKLRKELEFLRLFIEKSIKKISLQSNGRKILEEEEKEMDDDDDDDDNGMLLLSTTSREDIWLKNPELQFLQTSIGGLRNEIMHCVNEFQLTRGQLRSTSHKLQHSKQRVAELEQKRHQDTLKMQQLEDQTLISQQARDISTKEKMDILKWSQKMCQNNEVLTQEMENCQAVLQEVVQQLIYAREMSQPPVEEEEEEVDNASCYNKTRNKQKKAINHLTTSEIGIRNEEEEEETLPTVRPLLKPLEKEIQLVLTAREKFMEKLIEKNQLIQEKDAKIIFLQKENNTKTHEQTKLLTEMKQSHASDLNEMQQMSSESIKVLEKEKQHLQEQMDNLQSQVDTQSEENHQLTKVINTYEQDLDVMSSILHVFLLSIRPLVFQVSELLTQKKYLTKQVTILQQAQEEIQQLSIVLQEVIPLTHLTMPNPITSTTKTKTKTKWKIAMIAVCALNRFKKNRLTKGFYGTCQPLLQQQYPIDLTSGQPASHTMLKTLCPQQTMSHINLRELLDQLKQYEITERVIELVEQDGQDLKQSQTLKRQSTIGSILLDLLTLLTPEAPSLIVENVIGQFHSKFLITYEKKSQHQKSKGLGIADLSTISSPALPSVLTTVMDLRTRVLTLGKRVEDLQYQRNTLQKDVYELTHALKESSHLQEDIEVSHLHQQEMEILLTQEKTTVKEQQRQFQQEIQKLLKQMDTKQSEVDTLVQEKNHLSTQIKTQENTLDLLKQENSTLQKQIDQFHINTKEEEDNAMKLKKSLQKSEQELKVLKQATKKVHLMYHQTNEQLDLVLTDKSRLQKQVDQLSKQKQLLTQKLHHVQVTQLEDHLEKVYHRTFEGTNGNTTTIPIPIPPKVNTEFTKRTEGLDLKDLQVESVHLTLSPRKKTKKTTLKNHEEDVENVDMMNSSSIYGDEEVGQDKGQEEEEEEEVETFTTRRKHQQMRFPTNTTEEETTSSKRRSSKDKHHRQVNIERVNKAVHEYMDQIDAKLQKLYGIPPSSNFGRQTPQ